MIINNFDKNNFTFASNIMLEKDILKRIKIIEDYVNYLLLGNKSNCVLISIYFTYISFIALFNKEIFFLDMEGFSRFFL